MSIDCGPFRYIAHKLLKSGCTPVVLQADGAAQLFQAVNLLTSEGQNISLCLLLFHLHFPPEYFTESKFNLSALPQFSLCLLTVTIKEPSSNCLQVIVMQMSCKTETHPSKIIRIRKFIIKEQIKCLNKKKKQVSWRLITEFKNAHPEVCRLTGRTCTITERPDRPTAPIHF